MTDFDTLLFIYWCPQCRRHYGRSLAEPQRCGCGRMEAEHLATLDPRTFLIEQLNRNESLDAIRHGTCRTARTEVFHHDD